MRARRRLSYVERDDTSSAWIQAVFPILLPTYVPIRKWWQVLQLVVRIGTLRREQWGYRWLRNHHGRALNQWAHLEAAVIRMEAGVNHDIWLCERHAIALFPCKWPVSFAMLDT